MRNRLTRSLLFGAAFVGMLCNVVSAETVDEALARLGEKAKAHKTISMTLVSSMEGNGMKVEQTTISRQSNDGNRTQLYAESNGSMSMQGMPSQTMRSKIVSDGEILWNDVEQMGQRMVQKMKMPVEAKDPAGPYKRMVREGTATLKETATIDGAACTVFEIASPDVKSLLYVANDNGILLRVERSSPDGTRLTMVTKDLKLNAPLDGVSFSYTPPEGVEVMDMTAMDMDMDGAASEEPAAEVPAGS
jgi:outer membrane lipoprotein-sorting protein